MKQSRIMKVILSGIGGVVMLILSLGALQAASPAADPVAMRDTADYPAPGKPDSVFTFYFTDTSPISVDTNFGPARFSIHGGTRGKGQLRVAAHLSMENHDQYQFNFKTGELIRQNGNIGVEMNGRFNKSGERHYGEWPVIGTATVDDDADLTIFTFAYTDTHPVLVKFEIDNLLAIEYDDDDVIID